MFSLKHFRLRAVFFFRFNEESARVSEGGSNARGHLRFSRVLLETDQKRRLLVVYKYLGIRFLFSW